MATLILKVPVDSENECVYDIDGIYRVLRVLAGYIYIGIDDSQLMDMWRRALSLKGVPSESVYEIVESGTILMSG
jgi:hypothetical protein